MHVGVIETRQDRPLPCIDDVSIRTRQGAHFFIGPHGQDVLALYGDGLRQRLMFVQGMDCSIDQDQLRMRQSEEVGCRFLICWDLGSLS